MPTDEGVEAAARAYYRIVHGHDAPKGEAVLHEHLYAIRAALIAAERVRSLNAEQRDGGAR